MSDFPFVTRNPSAEEEQVIKYMLSTFSDGSGTQREKDGTSRAGWKEIERVFSEFLTGQKHSEDKDVFDLIARDWENDHLFHGISVKSKQLTKSKFPYENNDSARAYLEIANSPSKMWAGITKICGKTPKDFEGRQYAQDIGDSLLGTVGQWKLDRKNVFETQNVGNVLDIDNSTYLTLSLAPYENNTRKVQISSFSMQFPEVEWFYSTSSCLRAMDPTNANCPLFDWYPFAGGQLKYYPAFASSRYSSSVLELENIDEVAIWTKAQTYFEDEMAVLLSALSPEQIELVRHLLSDD